MVNCTPVGMYPNMQVCPISEKTAARYEALVDLIYNPKDTLFLQYGKRHGAITLNGMVYACCASRCFGRKFGWNVK